MHGIRYAKMKLALQVALMLAFYNAPVMGLDFGYLNAPAFENLHANLTGNSTLNGNFTGNSTYRKPAMPLDIFACDTRFQLTPALKGKSACMEPPSNPLCSRDIQISYADVPPYVFKGKNRVEGVLPGMYLAYQFC